MKCQICSKEEAETNWSVFRLCKGCKKNQQVREEIKQQESEKIK